jgi:hypothetical protein
MQEIINTPMCKIIYECIQWLAIIFLAYCVDANREKIEK